MTQTAQGAVTPPLALHQAKQKIEARKPPDMWSRWSGSYKISPTMFSVLIGLLRSKRIRYDVLYRSYLLAKYLLRMHSGDRVIGRDFICPQDSKVIADAVGITLKELRTAIEKLVEIGFMVVVPRRGCKTYLAEDGRVRNHPTLFRYGAIILAGLRRVYEALRRLFPKRPDYNVPIDFLSGKSKVEATKTIDDNQETLQSRRFGQEPFRASPAADKPVRQYDAAEIVFDDLRVSLGALWGGIRSKAAALLNPASPVAEPVALPSSGSSPLDRRVAGAIAMRRARQRIASDGGS